MLTHFSMVDNSTLQIKGKQCDVQKQDGLNQSRSMGWNSMQPIKMMFLKNSEENVHNKMLTEKYFLARSEFSINANNYYKWYNKESCNYIYI